MTTQPTPPAPQTQSGAVPPPPATTTLTMASYENNPFMVTINGIRMLYTRAQSIVIMLVVVIVLSTMGQIGGSIIQLVLDASSSSTGETSSYEYSADSSTTDSATSHQIITNTLSNMSTGDWIAIAIIGSIVFVVSLIGWVISQYIAAMVDYASASSTRGEQVTFGQTFRRAGERFLPYLWLRILVGLKTFLWSLLFIIPGIIMSVRYSLAGVSFFDKKLSANAAIKDSLALTKDAWLTTYASTTLFNLVTFGIVKSLGDAGARTQLYQQYDDLTKRGEQKPAAHALSWVTLILQLLFIPLIMAVVALMYFIASS